jgi:glutaredoxin
MIEIYSKENCSYCTNAMKYLNDARIPFFEYKLNEDFTKESLLTRYPNATTFPVIVVDGFYIGGFTELKEQVALKDSKKFLTEG